MTTLSWLNDNVKQPDSEIREVALARQQQLTKPAGSLGQMENLAVELAALQGLREPKADNVLVTVFAADHGVSAKGVSAYPREVTAQMVANFATGGAAVSVLAKQRQARFEVVNLGTVAPVPVTEGVIDRVIAPETADFTSTAAMTEEQLSQALAVGRERIQAQADLDLFIGGEMGIGNTSSATALAAALCDIDAAELCGPGTGLEPTAIARKAALLEQSVALHREHMSSPLETLRYLGGFEIAALTGAYIAAAQQGVPVLVDGFICTAAAVAACYINPQVRQWLFFAHCSAEPGQGLLLHHLAGFPLLQLEMRLGEGSGAVLALDLIRSACLLHNGMATFADAGVSDRG